MRLKLFAFRGMPCYIHIGTLIFALYFFLVGKLELFVLTGISILLHEGSHMALSALFGHRPQRLELTPLGAMVSLEDDERLSIGKRLAVLLAGPMASLTLCIIAVWLSGRGVLPPKTGRQLFCSNLLILLLNLLPVLPLDGGRITGLLLSLILPQERVRLIMRIVGSVIGGMMVAFNVLLCLTVGGWNLSLGMTGCFLLYAAARGTTSYMLSDLRMLIDRKIRLEQSGCLPCQMLAVMETTSLQQVVGELKPHRYTKLLILQSGTMNELLTTGESALVAAYLNTPWEACSCLVNNK